MKNNLKKTILLTGILCTMSLAVCACTGTKESQSMAEQQEDADTGAEGQPDAGKQEDAQKGGEDQAGQPSAENISGEWTDDDPNLVGDIKSLRNGQITVIEAFLDETDSGEEIIALPAEGGDDSDFNKVVVTYDDNTLFALKTIYDGGARFEMSEATAEDMKEGQFVDVWGSYSGGELQAKQIFIVEVVH